MEYRTLGAGGPTVSVVAYGNSLTHGNQVDDATARACVRAALDAGVTTFDTADAYADGRAEELLGAALSGVRRDDVVVCTKVGRSRRRPGGAPLSRARILACADDSLRRLRTGHIDLYQAHLWDDGTPLEETMGAFAELARSGRVRFVGVSEWRAGQIRAAVALGRELGVPIVSNQPQYSMLWRVPEAEVVPACDALGVRQMAWSPLAGGVLSGKYRPGAPPPAGSRVAAADGGAASVARWNYLTGDVLDAVARLGPVAAGAGMTLPQLALAWVLRNPAVACAVIGASRPGQLAENIRAVGRRLDAAVLTAIDEALGPVVARDPELTGRLPTRKATHG